MTRRTKRLGAILAALLLAGCATPSTQPTETTWCWPPYKSGLVTCRTYR